MKHLSTIQILLLCLLLPINYELFAKSDPLEFRSGNLVITLEDHLHHPYYWWPTTLLNYTVRFDKEPLSKQFTLKENNKGESIPFQISNIEKLADGKYISTLSFTSDLPSGEKKSFSFQNNSAGKKFPDVKVTEAKEYITVQTDKFSVRLPVSRGSSVECPGPVLGLTDMQGKWIGTSRLETSGKKVKSITTRPLSVGSLFAEYQVKYDFEDGAVYEVEIKCINGKDFFEVREKMSGFGTAGGVYWQINWNGFSPTHRQAPNRPYFSRSGYNTQTDKPGFGRFEWEEIDMVLSAGSGGIKAASPNGKLPFEVDSYAGFGGDWTLTSSVFWDANAMQSIGVFAKDASEWNDYLYPMGAISGLLSVEFYYRDKQLLWQYPLYNGKRYTAISCYDHAKDISHMDELEKLYQPQKHPLGFTYRVNMSQCSHNTHLQNRHGTIDLDRIKDWTLTYPDSLPLGPVIFKENDIRSENDLERMFFYSFFILELPVSGPGQNSGYGPANSYMFYLPWVQALNRLLPTITKENREKYIAMYLFHSYIAAGEEYMPMSNLLSQPPSWLFNVKGTAALAAFLLPEHPEAQNWEEMFSKTIELNMHYHTRPDVKAWDAKGGRTRQNLGTYVWSYLQPIINFNFLIRNHGSGRNFLAGEEQAMMGSWLLNSLSSPYDGETVEFYLDEKKNLHPHFWGIVTKEEGPRRVHSPQGAHSARRKPPAEMWYFGEMLKNYDPLLSENLCYVSKPDDDFLQKIELSVMYPINKVDKGTPPDFKSAKFTGYGTVFRAGVGTDEELSVHLSQIDKGPNNRWGFAADGGTGGIYFYAKGKSYSYNGKEDVGDRLIDDISLNTNFGVFKNGTFKSIGQNVLSRPLYDLEIGQFTEIVSSRETSYSYPEYLGRSIMLVGTDYFIVYDDVYFNDVISRFSWFTHPNEDIPDIQVIKAGRTGPRYFAGKPTKTELSGPESKGVWYDGSGDFLTFVSHKQGFQTQISKFGAIIQNPSGEKDFIFRNDTEVIVEEPEMVFSGLAGFIRKRENGLSEMAIFHGTKIGDENVIIETLNPEAGISAVPEHENRISGKYYSMENSQLTFRWRNTKPGKISFYLNGIKQTVRDTEDGISVNVPAGSHIWNIGDLPIPPRPEILFTRNDKGNVLFAIRPVPGASNYRYEYSTDTGETWNLLKKQSGTSILIKPKSNETKGYVRVIASNEEHSGKTSIIYPVYFTREKPPFPDGLKLKVLNSNEVDLSWGKVLGCDQFKLYRRTQGKNEKFQLVYKGELNRFRDKLIAGSGITEYCVASVNGNGEGKLSHPVTNDPDSWFTFDPMPSEPFRRTGLPSLLPSGDYNLKDSETYYPE